MKSLATKLTLAGSLLSLSMTNVVSKDTKLKPEELVVRHLDAIGSAEARSAVKTRSASGRAMATVRLGGQGKLSGPGSIFSEAGQIRVAMKFEVPDYPGEDLAFDGTRVSVGTVRPGQRTNLSSFVYHHDMMMKEGLLGGTLTTAWPLLDVGARQPKLTYTGLKKVEGRQLHQLKYRPRRGAGDLQVSLYFEPETFRHVLSQYRLVQPAGMATTPAASAGQRDSFFTIVETFADFRQVDGLTLPRSYKLVYTIEAQNNTYLAEWTITDIETVHNSALDPGVFSVQ